MGGYIECLPCPVGWLCSQGEAVITSGTFLTHVFIVPTHKTVSC